MDVLEPKEICEISTLDEMQDFKNYLDSNPSGFKIVATEYPDCAGLVLYSETGNFHKWVRRNKPGIHIEVQQADKRLTLRSGEYWLPLVFLANDVTLQIYLGIVANYLYDMMKGALKGEKQRVHLTAIFESNPEGTFKKFSFEGDIESLEKAITKFNLKKFYE